MSGNRRFFIYAPPLKGVKKSRRKPPSPPYANAPRWQWSVFYYWWEYLRRHEGYRATCEANGEGEFAELYADFGDVHATEFWPWWNDHAHLFAEPDPRAVEIVKSGDVSANEEPDVLFLRIPLENSMRLTTLQFRRLVKDRLVKRDRTKIVSRARYKVAAKPVLASLHTHLKVWDARRAYPDATLEQLADIASVSYNHKVNGETLASLKARDLPDHDVRKVLKRRKELVVKRHLRIAEQYIANVAEKGRFPLRSTR